MHVIFIRPQTPLIVPRPKLDIPVPHLTVNPTYHQDVPANFTLPRSYVRYHRVASEDEYMDRLDYAADQEDEAWLEANTKFGAATMTETTAIYETFSSELAAVDETGTATVHSPATSLSDSLLEVKPSLSLNLLERMLDVLEKKTGFESIVTYQQAEHLILQRIPELMEIFPASASHPLVTIKTVLTDVYNYWVQKRSKLKRPLLRKFWPVTSTEDTNPHLVFRPREKEKYRLRKKRQNDFDAYQKLQQLRNDFDTLRAVLRLVKHREALQRAQLQLQIDLFQQRLYAMVNATGRSRLSISSKTELQQLQEVPALMDLQERKNKRSRSGTGRPSNAHFDASSLLSSSRGVGAREGGDREGTAESGASNVAGRNHGEPAPNFLHPLATRESYVCSWRGTVPNIATYVDSHLEPTHRFRNRPRIGRGGRLCIDRIPLPVDPSFTTTTVVTVGKGLPHFSDPKDRLLELLPKPLNQSLVSRAIENICVAAVKDDIDVARSALDQDENDGAEVVVSASRWLETDDQPWGEERYSIPF
jgi:enhancer of polycomb-like protein